MKNLLTPEEIKSLSRIQTIRGLKKRFPEGKMLYSKLCSFYYMLKPKVWAHCSYKMKDGTWISDKGSFESHTNDIDYNHFHIDNVYTGNEKKHQFRNIWTR